jgi:hypothetical protein
MATRLARAARAAARGLFCYALREVKSSVSIVLFFLLSGFFLTVLLGAIEHSRKLLLLAGGCLAAVVCIIVFLTPVQLPSLHLGKHEGREQSRSTSTSTTVDLSGGLPLSTSTTFSPTATTELTGAE